MGDKKNGFMITILLLAVMLVMFQYPVWIKAVLIGEIMRSIFLNSGVLMLIIGRSGNNSWPKK